MDAISTGGSGADRFVFAPGDGRLEVADFGRGGDVIDLRGFGLAGIGEIRDLSREVGSRAAIDLDDDKLAVRDFGRADLDADNFLI